MSYFISPLCFAGACSIFKVQMLFTDFRFYLFRTEISKHNRAYIIGSTPFLRPSLQRRSTIFSSALGPSGVSWLVEMLAERY